MRGLYAIIDVDTLERRGLDVLPFAERVIAARPAAIQLRDKSGGARRSLGWLRELAPRCAEAGVPLFANDRPDLALLAGCAGVHVGQDDVPVALVRSLAARFGRERELKIGLSTHNPEQVERALDEAPDYVAVGPIFPTASKQNPSPVVGVDALRTLAARIRERTSAPIVAIGGITEERIAAVGAIADMVAVIGALLPPADERAGYGGVTERVRALHEAIVGGAP